MAAFDPHTQEVRFLLADGKTPIAVPIPEIDALNHISLSVCITYGAQLGACFIMLVVLVIMTPSNKFKTVSTILHILALVMCIIRMSLLIAYFPSGFNEFYNYWAVDYTSVSPGDYRTSIMGNVASLLVVVVIEAALVAQAQAMVHMWHNAVKHTLFIVSILLTLLTVSWRLAFTIFQCQATLDLESAHPFRWVARWSVITNAVSICWYCAIFNIKLTTHVFCNRGILLRSCKSLTAMDALVMTNGILMIVPVIFSALELGNWAAFEAASLTLTSVALILPLGTLTARRLSQSHGLGYDNFSSTTRVALPFNLNNSQLSPGTKSFATSSNATATPQSTVLSHCEAGAYRNDPDTMDLELCQLDGDRIYNGQVRVYHSFEQNEQRI